LLNLLPRFYDPSAGTIALDGRDLRGVRIADLRKHVALALLTAAPILVLDEPTSFQDGFHEEHLARTLRELRGRRTVIVVSHRIHTIKDCDLICVLEGGAIREMGTHGELLQHSGLYSRLAAAAESRFAA
jgi:ABC-type multidrug transport system fused ATPase/permease subunit